ncbi:MAG: hypothetical protein EVA65_10860 [Oceanococcus sp.]|nr:MAG: hypothetical protein EVA65_10860 [Oceanococcus sp.]
MGMFEDRKNAACDRIMYCERAYKESSNPYYVVAALDAAHWGEFTPPEWALNVLLDANRAAMRRHVETGERISIDAALGLAVGRGQRAPEHLAKKEIAERPAFVLVKTILACFDAAIPDACEVVYYAVARDFAMEWQEIADFHSLGREWKPDWSNLISADEWKARQAQGCAEFKREVLACGENEAVQKKLMGHRWWEILHGDRLGYSLDNFIERYYRFGTKSVVPSGRVSEQQMLMFKGHSLLMTPDGCATSVTYRHQSGYALQGVSALGKFKMRSDFEDLHRRLSKVGADSGL